MLKNLVGAGRNFGGARSSPTHKELGLGVFWL